jgi:hypothetical protein
MRGLKVRCPNCRRMDFETTDAYLPDVTPNGSYVECLLGYKIDWLTARTTLCSEMTCPECLALLAPGRRLDVIETEESVATDLLRDIDEAVTDAEAEIRGLAEFEEKPQEAVEAEEESSPEEVIIPTANDAKIMLDGPPRAYECPVCGQSFAKPKPFTAHMRAHEKEAET